MRIITVSRQFGSGGRELGKRLSEILGWDYYDKGILQQLADESGFDPEYVSTLISGREWRNIHLSYSNTFSSIFAFEPEMKTSLLIRQREIIEDIAKAGNDFIIVGRDADVILRDYRPCRIFVCADMENRIGRCMKHENKKDEKERLTEKEVIRNIRRIDSSRAQSRELVTGKSWADSTCFDLTVNTGGRDIRKLAQAVADYALRWFEP
ncbi:cytidylate kinase-like family protein [bacterium]|nr:cytidylate kinase-like family protein [bacterium]